MHNAKPLGSRLNPLDAEPPTLANYLSPQAKRQVQAAVREAATTGALLARPRLWVDLLSSQPLCFNLFGPLAEDPALATTTLQMIWPDIQKITRIRFEWSPGRGDERYTDNRSAFDVFVEYDGRRGRSFLAIEVKYHEDLTGSPAADPTDRYPKIAARHNIFREESISQLKTLPLQQIWLDHLLALQLRADPGDGWQAGTFVLLYPIGNTACAAAGDRYRQCLTQDETFDVRTLDEIVQAARLATTEPWPDDVYARYLDPAPVNTALKDAVTAPELLNRLPSTHLAQQAAAASTTRRTHSVNYEVSTPVPAVVVEATSQARLPFEPTGWLIDFRRELAQACRTLAATPGEILHAVYSSADRSRADIENILCYNLGTGAIRAAATHGLILERSYVTPAAAPHHYRYELTPDTVPWSTWRASERLATIRLTAPASLFAEPKAGRWWLAARRGEVTAHSNRQDPPDAYALSITVAPPVRWRGNLSSLIKPLADGLVSALHSHRGPLDHVLERASAIDPTLTPEEMDKLLDKIANSAAGYRRSRRALGHDRPMATSRRPHRRTPCPDHDDGAAGQRRGPRTPR